ncbi:carbohydrate ABC transporter permease [Cohnella hashimotonis]|uniref:Carbohydrate ABC transporter permease n=1 Tax=Cohnella hashimotonis TaxID=2826895 RepID=A0ABT6T9N4_9BACL|nr:carbohydrate ABC transporter permease [Cohnella hashimotonis]MDI4643533.1 carbohydrate ABC transporter permease [Cohnella hashimotonis]
MKPSLSSQAISHALIGAAALVCFLPFLLLVSASFTDEGSIIRHGYSFLPRAFSLDAYAYLLDQSATIVRAYGISALVTAAGTAIGLAISTLLAYPLSRPTMPCRGTATFLVFFTMLFHGGLVSFYLVYTDLLSVKNTIWALMLPNLLTNGFFILLMRSFFQTSIPAPIIESSYIDGANDFKIFVRMVLPLSLPILATIGLMTLISYWNDWMNGLIFITDTSLYSIQNLLYRMLADVQYLQNNNLNGIQTKSAGIPLTTVRMAIAVVGILPLLCAYPFFQKYFVKGLTIGAVKG